MIWREASILMPKMNKHPPWIILFWFVAIVATMIAIGAALHE